MVGEKRNRESEIKIYMQRDGDIERGNERIPFHFQKIIYIL